jgi:methionyl-tRNA formyltransferase
MIDERNQQDDIKRSQSYGLGQTDELQPSSASRRPKGSLQRILFFGNERLATGVTTTAPTLQALIAAGYDVQAVVVAQSDLGSTRKPRPLEVAEVAAKHGIPLLTPAKLSDAEDDLKQYGAEAAILVAFGKIIPESTINIFPNGIINIHPSLLPKHRGPTPIESVIIEGEEVTGVSLMRLVARMDAGPIYAQQSVKLKGNETKQALADQLLALGSRMLLEHLPAILAGEIMPKVQEEIRATRDEKISKDATELDFQQSAEQVVRQVRAYAGWPRSRAKIGTTEVIITEAHTTDINGTAGTLWMDSQELGVHCDSGTLIIDKLILPGKKEMTGAAFLAGYKPV